MAMPPELASRLTQAGKGRPKGAKGKRNRTIEALCDGVFGLPGTKKFDDFCERMRQQFMDGTLAPAVAQIFLHHWLGKPKEKIELELAPIHFDEMSDEELARRAAILAATIGEQKALPEAGIIDVMPEEPNEGTNEGTNATEANETQAA